MFDVSSITQHASSLEPTKRNVVSLVGKFFDPLGFLAPVIIRFKVFFQRLCECKIGWDEILSDELVCEWKMLLDGLQGDISITLPRSYLTGIETFNSCQLAGFCDASTQAYAAVVYLVFETENGMVVRFVASKTRVAPLKLQTIPRLELLSAVLLARLATAVSSSLEPILPQLNLKCFTDSQVVLFWIRGTRKEWKPFVRNRVVEIRGKVPPSSWNYCSGNTNPADLPSRGLSLIDLSLHQLWRRGPEWLTVAVPVHDMQVPLAMPEECAKEMKASRPPAHSLLVMETEPRVGKILNCEDYGSMPHLLRVTAYTLRAVKRFKNLPLPEASLIMTTEELSNAEKLWLIEVQGVLQQDRSLATSIWSLC